MERETGKVYRLWLYDQGEVRELRDTPETGKHGKHRGKGGFTRAEVEAEVAKGGDFPLHRVIRLRVRYLSDGVVFGSAAFVEGVFERHRPLFGEKRKTGARRMKGADWEDLRVLRELRLDRTG